MRLCPITFLEEAVAAYVRNKKDKIDTSTGAAAQCEPETEAWVAAELKRFEENKKASLVLSYYRTLAVVQQAASDDMKSAAPFQTLRSMDEYRQEWDEAMRKCTTDTMLQSAKVQTKPGMDCPERLSRWTKDALKSVRSEKNTRERKLQVKTQQPGQGQLAGEAARVQASAMSTTTLGRRNAEAEGNGDNDAPKGTLHLKLESTTPRQTSGCSG